MSSFFKLVEIQTKVASILPLACGLTFAWYHYQRFKIWPSLVFLFALLCVDMAVTALNNWMDFRMARSKAGYNYQEHNAIVRDGLSLGYVQAVVISLFGLGIALGVLLVLLTDGWVLGMGAMAFAIGIVYSFGPLPISRTPLGELFSGLTMGFGIFFIAVYIQLDGPNFFAYQLMAGRLYLNLDLANLALIFWYSLPLVLGIAGIMLANNTCDMADDRANGRWTLPLWIGQRASLVLMLGLYGIGVLFVVLSIIFGFLPWFSALIMGPAFGFIAFLLRPYLLKPDKASTFIQSVKAYLLMALAYLLSLGLAAVFS